MPSPRHCCPTRQTRLSILLPENIAASTDDNPFFYTSRFSDFVSIHSWDIMSNNAAIGITGLLIIVALCACGYYIVLPFLRLARRMPMATLTPPVAYFSAIGMGFMLIEISQMQRLMVFLGHPVYGLSVVLFTILLFSGLAAPRSVRILLPITRHRLQDCRAPHHARGGGC